MQSKLKKIALMRDGLGSFGKMAALKKGMLLNAGELQIVILYLLSQQPSHGYQIIKSVGELTSGVYAPSPGMVYPALTRIEKSSYAVSAIANGKKLFRITKDGASFLDVNLEQLNQVLGRMSFLGRKMALMKKHLTQDQMADEQWGMTNKENAEFHDLRNEFKALIFEKLNAAPEEKARIMKIIRETINKIRSK